MVIVLTFCSCLRRVIVILFTSYSAKHCISNLFYLSTTLFVCFNLIKIISKFSPSRPYFWLTILFLPNRQTYLSGIPKIFFLSIFNKFILYFLFILKVANIRCFVLIQCSEQEARFKKYVIMS